MTITKEGALASFYTVNKAPIKHLRVYFLPKQAGSGTASPENVREISGWNQIELYNKKKSLFPFLREELTITGSNYNGNSGWFNNLSVEYIPKTTLVYSVYLDATNSEQSCYSQTWIMKKDGKYRYSTGNTISAGSAGWSVATMTITNNDDWLAFGLSCKKGVIASKPMVEIGSIRTDYEPCINSTQTIDWSNDIGTIYGGYIDLITGELVQEWDGVTHIWQNGEDQTIDDETKLKKRFRLNYPPISGGANNISNVLNYGYGGTYVYNVSTNNSNGRWAYVTVPTDVSTNLEIQLIYKLATPITHQLSPQSLSTFIGRNNIWSNADRIEVEYDLAESNDELYRRRNILLQGAPHLETVTGSIANFKTDLIAPIKEAKVYFEPIQEGEGDSSPENIRPINGYSTIDINTNGKNLLNPATHYTNTHYVSKGMTFDLNTDGSLTIQGEIESGVTSSPQFAFEWIQPITENYYFCANSPYRGKQIETYMWDNTTSARCKQWDGVTNCLSSHANSSETNLRQVQLIAGHTIRFYIRTNYDGEMALNGTLYPMLLPSTCTDTTFEPYKGNTIPITFPTIGKNLLDITRTETIVPGASTSTITIADGVISVDAVATSARSHVKFSQIFPAGNYTIQVKKTGSIGNPKLLSTSEFSGSDYNSFYTAYVKAIGGSSNTLSFTLTEPSKIGLVLGNALNESGNPGTLYDIQLESGSTATAYEPYTNTIYGGYIDLNTGNIYKTYNKRNLKDYTFGYYTSYQYYLTCSDRKKTSTNLLSNLFPISTSTGYPQINKTLGYYSNGASYANIIFIRYEDAGEGSHSSEFNNWLQHLEDDPYIIYELETPQYITTLTSTQLKTLKGTNNIWSSANGPVSIKYWTH